VHRLAHFVPIVLLLSGGLGVGIVADVSILVIDHLFYLLLGRLYEPEGSLLFSQAKGDGLDVLADTVPAVLMVALFKVRRLLLYSRKERHHTARHLISPLTANHLPEGQTGKVSLIGAP
jgi:hypothetical protein